MNPEFIWQFTEGYIRAAEWSSHGPEGGPEFIDGTFARWTRRDRAKAACLCYLFCRACEADLVEAEKRGCLPDSLGHDLWLTAAGHGTGYWDRPELDADGVGTRLTEACKHKPWSNNSNIYAYGGWIRYEF